MVVNKTRICCWDWKQRVVGAVLVLLSHAGTHRGGRGHAGMQEGIKNVRVLLCCCPNYQPPNCSLTSLIAFIHWEGVGGLMTPRERLVVSG